MQPTCTYIFGSSGLAVQVVVPYFTMVPSVFVGLEYVLLKAMSFPANADMSKEENIHPGQPRREPRNAPKLNAIISRWKLVKKPNL